MSNHLLNTYARTDFAIERGEGCYIYTEASEDRQSQRYLDFGAGIAVTSLGHSHPHLVKTLKDQADKLWHTSNLYRSTGQEKLATRLCENSFADYAFFTNSGAESNECAIKMARRYHYEKGNEHKVNILTFDSAFHGRTLATIAAGGQEKYLEGFGPKAAGFIQAGFEDWEQTQILADENCAAIMLEPIQGEGGLRPFSTAFLTKLRQLCDERDILLIFDEIQTGIGRTGQLFAYQNAGVEPDIIALAKGLGGGFPVGACLANANAASGMKPGIHGTTYGGNPMAMAVANAVLDVMLEDGFLDHVKRVSGYFSQKLMGLIDSHPTIFEKVMGDGLLTGLKCVAPNLDILQELYKNQMLAVPAGQNVLRILPPLIVTEKEIDEAIAVLDKAATTLENKGK